MGALALASALGCDRNIEPYQPGEAPREADLARIFPGPTAPGPTAAEASAGAAGVAAGRSAFPPSRTEAAGGPASGELAQAAAEPAASPTADSEGGEAATSSGGQPISGRVEVALELADEQPAGAVLFVIARPQGARGGPPLAVLRIPEPEFPLEFEIGPRDVMIPSMRFEGPISLTARLDADGNAMTRGETDLSSEAAEPLVPGTAGIELVLARKG